MIMTKTMKINIIKIKVNNKTILIKMIIISKSYNIMSHNKFKIVIKIMKDSNTINNMSKIINSKITKNHYTNKKINKNNNINSKTINKNLILIKFPF